MVKLSKSSKGERKEINKWKKDGERKAMKRGENKIRIFKKRIQRVNTSKQHKMKKKKAQGPFFHKI